MGQEGMFIVYFSGELIFILSSFQSQFKNAEKIKDGVGLQLLLKMGWKEGTGLGKNNGGLIEPIIPSLKFDTRGLASKEERAPKVPLQLISATQDLMQKILFRCFKNIVQRRNGPFHFTNSSNQMVPVTDRTS